MPCACGWQERVRVRRWPRVRCQPNQLRRAGATQCHVPGCRAEVFGRVSARTGRPSRQSSRRTGMRIARRRKVSPAAKSLNPVPIKERMKLPRQTMLEQPALLRARNFKEVNLGYSEDLARAEAQRCLECAKPVCIKDCPVGVKVKEFVQLIVAGDYLAAAAKIREDNVLPAITGRVCPQEDHCEGGCLMGKKVQPVGIGYLERFVADYEQKHMDHSAIRRVPPTGKKVAIVGSGPSCLTAAGDLVQKGHQVRVFEALHELGGVLV